MASLFGKDKTFKILNFKRLSQLVLFLPEPAFGRFVTLQRVSSVVSDYSLNWQEVVVHHEAVDISEDDTLAVKIAIDTNMKH